MHLLFAEDEPAMAEAVIAYLEYYQYTVDWVSNGTDAYCQAIRMPYDGLILDIMMPGMDGLQVLSSLREKGKNMPVLLLTAKSQLQDKVHGFETGADDYLPKPFAMEELLARVNAMMRRRENYAIGIRIISKFIDDVYANVDYIKKIPGIRVFQEKDYISQSKPNGYRSYHIILEIQWPLDKNNIETTYYAEIQLRTIAMDTWAALEHEIKYKKDLPEPELIADELRRCANELAACDLMGKLPIQRTRIR